ncbi:MAG: hypothetical protein NVSMB52_08390 [Chloroflexota bacterium]
MDGANVESVGGRLVRVSPGTPLGVKLNLGIAHAEGEFVQRMDDDDYYASDFLDRNVEAICRSRQELCRPTIAGMGERTFFDLARWELRRSPYRTIGGPTMLMPTLDVIDNPFRPAFFGEDNRLKKEFGRLGGIEVGVDAGRSFLQVRHRIGHTWRFAFHTTVENSMTTWELHEWLPDDVLPAWAVAAYRGIQADLLRDANLESG